MIRSYLEFMLKSPVMIWWAGATFALEVLAFALPDNPVVINKVWLVVGIFVVSLGLFIGVLVLYKGWDLYSRAFDTVKISQVVSLDNRKVFLMNGWQTLRDGTLLELIRKVEGVEITIGVIKVSHHQESGTYQADPVWIKPVHMRDIEIGALSYQQLYARQSIDSNVLSQWIDEQAEIKVVDAMKRGQ